MASRFSSGQVTWSSSSTTTLAKLPFADPEVTLNSFTVLLGKLKLLLQEGLHIN